ncbi:MAG: transcription termination/antitermination protein NusG [bacterium]
MSATLRGESWYAIYCISRHERQVNERLNAKGISTFLAEALMRVQWGSRIRKVNKNLLPGYVLVHAQMDPDTYLRALQTPSVVKFVGNPWPNLSWIPDEQVDSLRLLLGSGETFSETPYWKSGDRVEVIAGPLMGLKGLVVTGESRRQRVIVSLDLLQRSLAVEVDSANLRALRSP